VILRVFGIGVNKKRPFLHAVVKLKPFPTRKEAAMNKVTDSSAFDKSIQQVRALAESLGHQIQQWRDQPPEFYEMEKQVLAHVLKIGFHAIEAILHALGPGDWGQTVTTEQGQVLHRSPEPQCRRLRTVFGEHTFSQFVYARGPKQAIELRAVEARLNLSPRVGSYLFEEFSQYFCVESAFGQSAEHFETVFGQSVSVNTLELISQTMGAQAQTYLEELAQPPANEEEEVLVGTLDGKGVPLIQPQPEKVKAFETRRQRPGNRRMATLAGVYSVARYRQTAEQIVAALFRDEPEEPATEPAQRRPRPQHKRITPHFARERQDADESFTVSGSIEACCWMEREIDQRRQARQPLVVLVDGDHRLWDTVDRHLPDDRVEILDIVHVSAYLWRASDVFCSSQPEREAFTRTRLLKTLKGGVKGVIRGLRRLATSRGLQGEKRKTITTIARYLESHASRMKYDRYLKAGFPIATGVIEGACRHLVKDRMERTGMRWTLRGATAMLNVRAVKQCDHWDAFQAHRRQTESSRFHPHCQIAKLSKPPTLAI
jgi:hypothetical protein